MGGSDRQEAAVGAPPVRVPSCSPPACGALRSGHGEGVVQLRVGAEGGGEEGGGEQPGADRAAGRQGERRGVNRWGQLGRAAAAALLRSAPLGGKGNALATVLLLMCSSPPPWRQTAGGPAAKAAPAVCPAPRSAHASKMADRTRFKAPLLPTLGIFVMVGWVFAFSYFLSPAALWTASSSAFKALSSPLRRPVRTHGPVSSSAAARPLRQPVPSLCLRRGGRSGRPFGAFGSVAVVSRGEGFLASGSSHPV